MRCSEVGLQTQEMLANNRNTAVKPTAFEKQSMKPHRGDDSQTRAALGQQHGRSYRRFANSGHSGPTTRSVSPMLRKIWPLRANNTVGLTDSSQTRAAPANTRSSQSTTWGHSTIRNDAKAVRFPVATPGHSQSYWRVGLTEDTRNA
jgi:hypothetical protein